VIQGEIADEVVKARPVRGTDADRGVRAQTRAAFGVAFAAQVVADVVRMSDKAEVAHDGIGKIRRARRGEADLVFAFDAWAQKSGVVGDSRFQLFDVSARFVQGFQQFVVDFFSFARRHGVILFLRSATGFILSCSFPSVQ
jgi:hypothetical protein